MRVLGGALAFASVEWIPNIALDGLVPHLNQKLQAGSTIRSFMAKTFRVSRLPIPSGVPRPDIEAGRLGLQERLPFERKLQLTAAADV